MALNLGEFTPDFTLPGNDGKDHTLSDYRGQWVVLYFYPKDDTPGCTTEACGIRDQHAELANFNAVVIGVSKDTVASHQKFASKYSLPFLLLADSNKEVLTAYDVLTEKSMFGKKITGTKRQTFLIDPEGKLAKIYPNVNPSQHATEIIKDLTIIKTGHSI